MISFLLQRQRYSIQWFHAWDREREREEKDVDGCVLVIFIKEEIWIRKLIYISKVGILGG